MQALTYLNRNKAAQNGIYTPAATGAAARYGASDSATMTPPSPNPWPNIGAVWIDPEVTKSYIGQVPSSSEYGNTSKKYTYVDPPPPKPNAGKLQYPPAPPPSTTCGNGGNNVGYHANVTPFANHSSNKTHKSLQKPAMQAFMKDDGVFLQCHISYGGRGGLSSSGK